MLYNEFLEWNSQETSAYKKAREEKILSMQKVEITEPIKQEKDTSCIPDKSIVNATYDIDESTSSW